MQLSIRSTRVNGFQWELKLLIIRLSQKDITPGCCRPDLLLFFLGMNFSRKLLILFFLIIPFLSFGQVSYSDLVSFDNPNSPLDTDTAQLRLNHVKSCITTISYLEEGGGKICDARRYDTKGRLMKEFIISSNDTTEIISCAYGPFGIIRKETMTPEVKGAIAKSMPEEQTI